MPQPPRAQLRKLLTDLFDLDGLRMFALDHYESLVEDVRWGESERVAADGLVSALQERYLVDDDLFDRLRESRPRVRRRIEAVRATCRPVMPSLREPAETQEGPSDNGASEPPKASSRPLRASLSYSSRYKDWVSTLHRNLEASLKHAGTSEEVFFDQVDLASGGSWINQLEGGLDRAAHLVLVAAPEALASTRVADEIGGFIAQRADWSRGHFHLILLVDGPLPPFLEQIQYLDFRHHDEAAYRQGLRRLVAGLLERSPRDLSELPEIEVPDAPTSTLPSELRAKLVGWLSPVLETRVFRRAVATSLAFEPHVLEGHPSRACAASAALVLATGDDDPAKAALRVTDILVEELEEDRPERVAELRRIRAQLVGARSEDPAAGLLGAWLRKVAKDHERLVPYFGERTDLAILDRVYVQLRLSAERFHSRRGPEGPEDAVLARGPWSLRDLLDLDPQEQPSAGRRWVVLGDPGAGKTTMLRHLAATLAREAAPPWVPVFESLSRLLREPEWLLDRLARQMKRAGTPADGLPAVLDRAGQEGRLLVLLDGLDEVDRERRDEAEDLVRQLSGRWPKTPLVVTSRPIGYRRPGGEFRELELLPLDSKARRELLARWFAREEGGPDTERAEAAAAALEQDAGLRDLASNPLYLTLMALLIEQGTSPERKRTGLYDQVFKLLLDGGYKYPKGEPMEAQAAVRRVLRHLAHRMTRDNRDAEPVTALEARLYQSEADTLREPLERIPRWRRSMRPFLDDLAERTGILGPHDGPETDWRYLHRTFREALASEALEETLQAAGGEEKLLEDVRTIAGEDLGRWAEPYALLAGRAGDPDSLVRALVEENRELGLRALATAQGLREETLREVLELSEEWKERAKVYGEIPELVGDPDRALSLLDQLRRQTRDGNDLYHLEEAVEAVGEKRPEIRRAAGRLQRRFYGHIPDPPEDLFRWIETPLDGRVELWREIPAGQFLMGSPPDEEGRFDQEDPQHEVRITSSFQIAAAPVTVAQYAAFDPGHRSFHQGRVPDEDLRTHPVETITWYQAMAFCRWLSASFAWARGARLPTEEEWEYACRAGSATRFWSGDDDTDLDRVGWYDENSEDRTHRVGEKPANSWGLYDVHGNVWEWTLSEGDDYSDREGGMTVDPAAIDPADLAGRSGAIRVIRGGSCRDVARRARSAYRGWGDPGFGFRDLGFRVLLPGAPRSSS